MENVPELFEDNHLNILAMRLGMKRFCIIIIKYKNKLPLGDH